MKVVVINYGMGNLGSVRRALEECGADVLISDDPLDLEQADRIILPGVGAFREGMANLNTGGWVPHLYNVLKNPQVLLLGICLGMQLLAEEGEEGGRTTGLGLIPGKVVRFTPSETDPRIPHVGWNEIHHDSSSWLLKDIKNKTDFYFVHSYHLQPAHPEYVLATTPYAGEFVSVVGCKNVLGTQFHPEKSSRPGFQLLRNFLAGNPYHA